MHSILGGTVGQTGLSLEMLLNLHMQIETYFKKISIFKLTKLSRKIFEIIKYTCTSRQHKMNMYRTQGERKSGQHGLMEDEIQT